VSHVRETGDKFANMNPRLRSSIVATVTQRFDIFRTGGVRLNAAELGSP